MPLDMAAFGELGLTGQVRPVSQAIARLKEATRFGMGRVLGHASGSAEKAHVPGLVPIGTVRDAMEVLQ